MSTFSKIPGRLLHRWWLIAPAILLFGCIVLKAATASLTWDEAHTFFEHVRTPAWLPREYNYMSANNHLLNTWTMKISVALFGESELALRLPNVLAGGIFLLALSRLLLRFVTSRIAVLSGFVLLSCNPYVLDFFSIARGYGISIGMIMCGIYFSALFIAENFPLRRAVMALLFFMLAALACLTCLHVLLPAAFLFALLLFFKKENGRWKKIGVVLVLPLLFLALLLPFVMHLQEKGAFFLGKEVTSPLGVLASLGDATGYAASYSTMLNPWLVRLLYLIPVVAAMEIFRRRKMLLHGTNGVLLFLFLLFLLSFLSPIVQHYALHSNFISGRAALFYLPLLFLLLVFSLAEMKSRTTFPLLILALLAVAHFCVTLNARSYFDYAEQADVKEAMKMLKAKNIPVVEKAFANVITSDLPYEEQINYYRMRLELQNFGHCARHEMIPACSWFYLPAADTGKYSPCDVLHYFPQTKTALFRLKNPPQLQYVTEVWQDFEHEDPYLELRTDTIFLGDKGTFANAAHPYSIAVPLTIPDTVNGNLAVSVNCRLRYFTRNTSALLVFQFDPAPDAGWEGMYFDELSIHPGEWSMTGWTRPVPPGAKKIRVYLWNRDKTDVLMDNVAVRLLRY